MSYLRQAALAKPRALILKSRFWYQNFGLILVTLAAGMMVVALFPQTYPKGEALVTFFSLLIHGLAVFGIFYAVLVAARIDVDDALAQRVELKASRELDKIRSGLVDRIKISRLESIIPNNPYWNRGMIKLFGRVLQDTRDRRVSQATEAMQPYRERSVGDIFFIQNLQRIALHLGILGTFIGLVYALSYLNDPVVTHASEQEGDFMSMMISSLHLSFCTSIAGLQASVALGLLMMALRRRQEAYFDHMESATSKFVSLSRKVEVADEYLLEFEQMRESIRSHEQGMQGQARVVKNQTEEIRTGLDRLMGLKKTFNDFLEDIRGEQAHVLSEMKSVYKIISPKQVAEDLEASLDKSIRKVSRTFNSDLQQGLEELDRYNDSLDKLKESMASMSQQAETHAKEFWKSNKSLHTSSQQLYTTMEKTTKIHGDMLTRLEEASRLDIDAIFVRLQKLLDDQRQVMNQSNRLLGQMVAKPTFFETFIVQPWMSLRSIFQ